MTCQTFYEKLLTYIRKDVRGKTLSVDEFNELIPVVNYELYNHFYSQWEESQVASDALLPWKRFNQDLDITSNKVALTGGDFATYPYQHLIGRPRRSSDTVFDVVTALEYSERYGDALTQPTISDPVCFVADNDGVPTLYTYPDTVSDIYIDYLVSPTDPFLDYYINDTTYVVTYMADGATGVSIPSGSTYRDGTAGATTKDSQTHDIEFSDEHEGLLLDLFLAKLGLQTRDPMVVEYANMEQAKKV